MNIFIEKPYSNQSKLQDIGCTQKNVKSCGPEKNVPLELTQIFFINFLGIATSPTDNVWKRNPDSTISRWVCLAGWDLVAISEISLILFLILIFLWNWFESKGLLLWRSSGADHDSLCAGCWGYYPTSYGKTIRMKNIPE